jgi:hypothetical protein
MNKNVISAPTPEMTDLLKRSGSANRAESLEATHQLAVALEQPLRQGVMSGDITGNIYETITLEPGARLNFLWIFLLLAPKKILLLTAFLIMVEFPSVMWKATMS